MACGGERGVCDSVSDRGGRVEGEQGRGCKEKCPTRFRAHPRLSLYLHPPRSCYFARSRLTVLLADGHAGIRGPDMGEHERGDDLAGQTGEVLVVPEGRRQGGGR